jgi:signal transduction histidine kinase
LRILQELMDSDLAAAGELMAEIQGQATDALVTLRDLARGIYPPALVDRGIVAALEGHLAKSRQAASLTVYPENSGARFAPQVEAAIYFCVLEALQNGAKHAPDAALRVRLNFASNCLVFEVTDNGQGFDPAVTPAGTGLHGMQDRLAAVGGTLQVRSARGQGTTIEGALLSRNVGVDGEANVDEDVVAPIRHSSQVAAAA